MEKDDNGDIDDKEAEIESLSSSSLAATIEEEDVEEEGGNWFAAIAAIRSASGGEMNTPCRMSSLIINGAMCGVEGKAEFLK